MKSNTKTTSLLAASAVLIGLASTSAIGCQDLTVGPTVPATDTFGTTPGLDEPGTTPPGNNIVPGTPRGR